MFELARSCSESVCSRELVTVNELLFLRVESGGVEKHRGFYFVILCTVSRLVVTCTGLACWLAFGVQRDLCRYSADIT